jgi:predicted dienelactone hydrolase
VAHVVILLPLFVATPALAYDPLATARDAPAAAPQDFTIRDPDRRRDIPVRVYLPSQPGAAPVVLVSHGLGGSRAGSAYLGRHWAARGYDVT